VFYIWIAVGSEESIIFDKFMKSCYFHYLCGPGSGKLNYVAGQIALPVLFTGMLKKFLKAYSESSFPGTSINTNF
jgi:hypothetical protein